MDGRVLFIGIVKRSLKKTARRRLLSLIQLQTVIKEIESVVNSRPLVYVGDDINSNIPLTPGHFLSLNPKTRIRCIEDQKDQDYTPFQSTGDTVYKSWKKGQRLLDQFWALWREEYLTGLRERKQYLIRSNRIKSNSVVQKGDVVLIKDNTPRGCWKIGRIIDYIVSRDGQIRSAEIQLAPGKVLRSKKALEPFISD